MDAIENGEFETVVEVTPPKTDPALLVLVPPIDPEKVN